MNRMQPRGANHEQVYRVLRSARGPMTAYQILDAVRPKGISAPPTVYRALNRLMRDGLAHRLESMNAYVACADPQDRHDSAIFAIWMSYPLFGSSDVSSNALKPSPVISVWR